MPMMSRLSARLEIFATRPQPAGRAPGVLLEDGYGSKSAPTSAHSPAPPLGRSRPSTWARRPGRSGGGGGGRSSERENATPEKCMQTKKDFWSRFTVRKSSDFRCAVVRAVTRSLCSLSPQQGAPSSPSLEAAQQRAWTRRPRASAAHAARSPSPRTTRSQTSAAWSTPPPASAHAVAAHRRRPSTSRLSIQPSARRDGVRSTPTRGRRRAGLAPGPRTTRCDRRPARCEGRCVCADAESQRRPREII